ncbi:MAG: hypothetical protein PHW01_05415 [Patescibacteria group bacterium]|nr:hypothetical protein [Patescibacteria group bacterium]
MAQTLDKIALAPDLTGKKIAAMKIAGSNLFLKNRKIEFTAQIQWAALCAAREKIGKMDESLIRVWLFNQVRIQFIRIS